MGISDPGVNAALAHRWRLQLGVAAFIMLASGVVGLLMAYGYGSSPVVPVFFLLGGLAGVGAVRSVPRGVTPEERPAMRATALWIVAALALFIGVPLVLSALGWA